MTNLFVKLKPDHELSMNLKASDVNDSKLSELFEEILQKCKVIYGTNMPYDWRYNDAIRVPNPFYSKEGLSFGRRSYSSFNECADDILESFITYLGKNKLLSQEAQESFDKMDFCKTRADWYFFKIEEEAS